MGRYKKYENLPWWLNNLNGNTLTPTQKEVLDLDYYCKKFGTKLSHEKAANKLDRGRHTIYVARRRLEALRLRSTLPAKGSYKLGYPIEYQAEANWRVALQSCGVDPSRFKMKRKSSSKKKIYTKSSSSSKHKVASVAEARVSAPGGHPPNPPTNRCSGVAEKSPTTKKTRDEFFREIVYKGALNKLLGAGWSLRRAERLAQIKTDNIMAKRNTIQKSE